MKCSTVYIYLLNKFLLLETFKWFVIIQDVKFEQTLVLPNLTACHSVNFTP
jgi:hypothetical protein